MVTYGYDCNYVELCQALRVFWALDLTMGILYTSIASKPRAAAFTQDTLNWNGRNHPKTSTAFSNKANGELACEHRSEPNHLSLYFGPWLHSGIIMDVHRWDSVEIKK